MPVALSVWRARIGTFIHRIKDYVVREMREELLKERIQRLRVLWKRLKAKKDDSEGGSQDHKTRQAEGDSTDSSLVNQQGDCKAEPCTKTGQDSPQPCCVGSDVLHYEPSGQTVTSQTDSASLSTPTHSKVSSILCLSRLFLSFFFSPSLYRCFPFIFLLFSSLCLPLSPGFDISVSVSLSFLVVFPLLFSLFLSPFIPFSRRERSFGECHTLTASPVSNGSGLKEAVDKELPQQPNPNLQESMLVRAGDVELNPGPRQGTIDSVLQDMELVLLAKDVPGDNYYELCICMGVSYIESKNLLTEYHLNIPGALLELFFGWKMKQRDGTDCRAVLGEILEKAEMGALQTKLLEGGYLKSDRNDHMGSRRKLLTQEEVDNCSKDFKTFYRSVLCKISTDPLDFTLFREFEQIYTNLVLLQNKTGDDIKEQLEYDHLLIKEINGILPKRMLIEGEGGAGKTTFCSKIAWDWANGYNAFKQFEWVIVIPMRDIGNSQTVGEIAKTYLSDGNHVQASQIDDYISSEPSKVLLIFDGLDEYNKDILNDESHFGNIVRCEKFKDTTVLITTRPWKAKQLKVHQKLSKIYTYIGVEGFSEENVSSYIRKYFGDDDIASTGLINFIEENDVIKENMAPYPIFILMLCILWRESPKERRILIRKLKTFSQLFRQMIEFLKEHFIAKCCDNSSGITIDEKTIDIHLIEIGKIAFSGLLERQLTFSDDMFVTCENALIICSKIGILSREKQVVQRLSRSSSKIQSVKYDISFPHKLFQEYVAALFLASLYESNFDEFTRNFDLILQRHVYEYEYLLYFTSSQRKYVASYIIDKISNDHMDEFGRGFFAEIAFESYDTNCARVVGGLLFEREKSLVIDEEMSAHLVSGYMFVVEQHPVETLEFRRDCGPTVSRDVADLLSSPTSLTTLKLMGINLDKEFYTVILDNISKRGQSINVIQELHVDDGVIGGLHEFDTAIKTIFPGLKRLRFKTFITVSPVIVKRLAHATLEELSIERGEYDGYDERVWKEVPLIGEPYSAGQLFQDCFPQLISLVFKQLIIGNIRTRSILQGLKKHQHLKSICIFACFTDNELDHLAEEMNDENRIKVTLKHDEGQSTLNVEPSTDLLDAICHRTSVCELVVVGQKEDGLCFPDLHGKEVDSKIHTVNFIGLDVVNQQSGSRCLGRFLSLLPRLTPCTHLTISSCSFHDDFYKEIAEPASSTQIHTVELSDQKIVNQQSGSCFGRFISLLPRLTDLTIIRCSFHDDFYKEIAKHASSSQIHTVHFNRLEVVNQQSGSCCLGRFLCLLPRLTGLKIERVYFHDDFYREITERASSSQIQTVQLQSVHVVKQPLGSCFLGRFLCLLPRLTDLMINRSSFHDDFHREIAERASSSQIQTVQLKRLYFVNQQSGSCFLGRFLCLLPRLTDLMINRSSFHDDFYREIAERASSSQIHTVNLWNLSLVNQQSESRCLGRFLSLLSRLTYLTINCCYFHDDFYREIADRASSSEIHTVNLWDLSLGNKQSESRCLGRFLSFLPRLTDLTISRRYFHDDFYREIADRASSSEIHTVTLQGINLLSQQSESHCLGRFLSFLPRLTDLTISRCYFHDDFYSEIADRASSSQIQTVCIYNLDLTNQQSGSCCLGRFLFLLPHLTNLTNGSCSFHNDFYTENAELASSSESPYFMERKRIPLLDKYWPNWRKRQLPDQSGSSAASTKHSEVEPSQHQGSLTGLTNFPNHQLEVAKLNDPLTGLQSEPLDLSINQQVLGESIQFTSDQEQVTTNSDSSDGIEDDEEESCDDTDDKVTSGESVERRPKASAVTDRNTPYHTTETVESFDDTEDDEGTPDESFEICTLTRRSETDRSIPHHCKRIHSESSDDTGDDDEKTEESVERRPSKRRTVTGCNTPYRTTETDES